MPAPQRQAAPATLPSFASGKEGNNKLHSYQRLLHKRQRHISFRKSAAVAQRLCGHFPTRLAPIPASPSGGRRYMSPHPHPLPQAGEGVQGAALVLPRTPAARLACPQIKIQISGGCLNGATQERSEFRRTASQTRFLVSTHIASQYEFRPHASVKVPFCRAQKGTRLSGRDPTPSLKPSTPLKQKAGKRENTKLIAASARGHR